ncbi:MAG: alpha-L-fucosidase [Candidatus Omnitrophica bacterium]|nr:alpha-L-fucosidase [Candidatus Omnitrophota bacterium]
MSRSLWSRRNFLASCSAGLAGAAASMKQAAGETESKAATGYSQRLSLAQLNAWEALGYGMFIHFGMSTYVQNELPDGKAPATTYAPDRLDVDQWISVARDAGMKYAVLCAKHVAGHCLWPTRYTDYSVANSSDKTDVIGKFVEACRKRGVLLACITAPGTIITALEAKLPQIRRVIFPPIPLPFTRLFKPARSLNC